MSTAPSPTDAPRAAGRARDPVALSLAASALLFLALVLGNVALARTSIRADLTEDRLFTLSDASRRVLAGLTDPAKISVFWGEKLPARAEPVRRRLEGLLDEYVAAADGRLEVVWVKMDEKGKEEASKKGIYEGRFQELEANKITEAKDYDGLSIEYGARSEKLGPLIELSEDQQSFQLSSNVEIELSSALYKISRSKKAVVALAREAPPPAFMQMQGGGAGDRFSVLASQVFTKVYGDDFRDSLNLDEPVPAEVTVLVVAAPKEWTAKKVFHLEQFVLRGGKTLLLLDPVDVRAAWGDQPTTRSGLEDWLDHLGVKVTPGVVGDFDEGHMGAAMTRDGSLTAYPFFVRALREDLSQDNAATRDFASVPFYFAAELVVDAQKTAAASRKASILATTSPQGFVRADTSGLGSAAASRRDAKDLGRKTLLVQLEGPISSFWKGQPSPAEKPPEPAPATPPALPTDAPAPVTPPTPATDTDAAMAAPPAPDAPKAPETPKAPEPAPAPDAAKPADGPKGPEGEPGMGGVAGAPSGPARLDEGRGFLVLCGDAELVSDEFSGGRKDVTGGVTRVWGGTMGFAFVNNLVDWMTGSDDLLALRARGSAMRKLDEVGSDTATTAQTINFVVVPLLVLIVGILVLVVRRYRS